MMEKVTIGNAELYLGDCLETLKNLPDNSVDSIVTDPPYGLSFMGKKWDYDVPSVEIWQECFRVLKHGGHLLAFAGTRTQHRMAVRIEDAGFEIRDMIAWVYGSGFPKSLDVSKAIDKAAGAEREVVGMRVRLGDSKSYDADNTNSLKCSSIGVGAITTPSTDAAKQWEGWGTALKPALEPITVARKPLIGTVAQNVLAHGTGGINIDGCRVASEDAERCGNSDKSDCTNIAYGKGWQKSGTTPSMGRFPANFCHDGSDEVVALFPYTKSGARTKDYETKGNVLAGHAGKKAQISRCEASEGSAARFFYCAKASKQDRGENNNHPTVKPQNLMSYLCRLVTPPNGTVLDPFMGSGSTGKAAVIEGFNFIGCELSPEYMEIAKARIAHAQKQVDMFAMPEVVQAVQESFL